MASVVTYRPGTPLSKAGGLPARRGEVMPVEFESPQDAKTVAFRRTARESGYSQTQYIANTLDVQRISNALRAAERGDTWLYFTICRDMVASFTHLQAEWNKRKMVIVGQPMSLVPHDPKNADDVLACDVVREAIENCRNWKEGLQHLLDATLYPLSAAEKIWEPIGLYESGNFKYLKRMRLKEIAPINYNLLCFKVPYNPTHMANGVNPSSVFNPDDWEAWLRFYSTEKNGSIDYSTRDVYSPDPNLHIIHRGNLLSPSIPPNFGGHIRAILFYWLLITQDRDWWGLMMAKYGMPIPVAKVDSNNKNTVQQMQSALALGTQLGGVVIDKKAEIEWASVAGTDGSNAHKIFSEFCNAEVSKIVVGQTLSSKPASTGMGSGASEQAEHVRDDIRTFDVGCLSDTLRSQLFTQILRLNGYSGKAPSVAWGGISATDAKMFAQTQQQLSAAGYELTDTALEDAGRRLGYTIQRRPIPIVDKGGGQPN